MVYINECIDCTTEFGKKYLALVSKDDDVIATHLHHIVPVAYFKDVLGISECRKKGSPDMDPDNLVKLSVGKHLLAHYYLMKCAKQCIKAQMVNAFMCTYKTTSVDGITEEDVIARMAELDEEYATLKNGKRPHKDEISISNGKNKHRLTRWLNGEKYGPYVVYDNDGRIKELGKYGSDIKMQFTYLCELDECLLKTLDNRKKYRNDELVDIYVHFKNDSGQSVNFWLDTFCVCEMSRKYARLVDMRNNKHDDEVIYPYSYYFRTPRGDTLSEISSTDIKRIDSWVKKTVFSDNIYEILASIMDLIRKCKDIAPHMYKNLVHNPVLNALASRAKTKSKDITEMLSTINEYVNSKVIPCELLPSVA